MAPLWVLSLPLLWVGGAVGHPTAQPQACSPSPCGVCLWVMVGLGALGGAMVVAGGLLCQRLLRGAPPPPPELWGAPPPPWGDEEPPLPSPTWGPPPGPPQPHVTLRDIGDFFQRGVVGGAPRTEPWGAP